MDKLQKWAHVAEIAGAVAVVISLVYVGVQIRENTDAQQSQTEMNLFSLGFAWDEWWQDPGFVAIVAKASNDRSALTTVEQLQIEKHISLGLNLWAYGWKSYERDQIDAAEWQAWDNWFRSQMTSAIWQETYADIRDAYHVEFQRHVDSVTANP